MQRVVRVNAGGLRVGEDHPNAKLTDAEVDLIRDMLDEREAFIERLHLAGYGARQIGLATSWQGLSYGEIARRFDVSKSAVRFYATYERRAQVVVGSRTVHVPD